ncbi:hypothetical protein RvY_12137, partial [Ramazzottius varieornatus]
LPIRSKAKIFLIEQGLPSKWPNSLFEIHSLSCFDIPVDIFEPHVQPGRFWFFDSRCRIETLTWGPVDNSFGRCDRSSPPGVTLVKFFKLLFNIIKRLRVQPKQLEKLYE